MRHFEVDLNIHSYFTNGPFTLKVEISENCPTMAMKKAIQKTKKMYGERNILNVNIKEINTRPIREFYEKAKWTGD